MLTFALAFGALFIGDLLANVLTLPVHALEKRLQWAGKSPEQWRALGIESPAERLPFVSFCTGLLSTVITRLAGFLVASQVFEWRGQDMPVGFIVAVGAILLVNDGARVARFVGNSGIWTELGYAAGGLGALAIVLLQ